MPSVPVKQAYFITSGVACTLTNMRNGMTAAIHIIGREGFVGLPFLFASDTFPNAATVVHIAGSALRIDARVLLQEMSKPGTLQTLMRRYAMAEMVVAMQAAACNGLHSISERLALWLLMTSDRAGTDFRMTHETIAQILGSRRATVTIQAELLQRLGLLTYSYGRIHIANQSRLTQLACECYELQKQQLDSCINS
jgi:CRP-like cAMP-binding protein